MRVLKIGMPNKNTLFKSGKEDVVDSLQCYKLWIYLAWSEIKQRYRGSVLGPFWITLSMLIMIFALSVVYAKLFHQPIKELVPFMTVGIICWSYITSNLSEASDVFINAKDYFHNTRLPYTIHIFKLITKNLIIFAHHFVVYFFVVLYFRLHLHIFSVPLFLLSILFVTSILAGASLFLAILGARYRDISPIVTSLITVAFFVSPVTWRPEMIGNSLVIKLNPFTYILDLLRSPLLGESPHFISYFICLCLGLLSITIPYLVLLRTRSKIAFWL